MTTSKSILDEARELWDDDVSFLAALNVKISEIDRWGGWNDLDAAEKQEVAERMMEQAVSRARA